MASMRRGGPLLPGPRQGGELRPRGAPGLRGGGGAERLRAANAGAEGGTGAGGRGTGAPQKGVGGGGGFKEFAQEMFMELPAS